MPGCAVAAPARVDQCEQAGDRAPVRGERGGVAGGGCRGKDVGVRTVPGERLLQRPGRRDVREPFEEATLFEPGDPTGQRLDSAGSVSRLTDASEHPCRSIRIVRREGVIDCVLGLVMGLEPCGGAVMERLDQVGFVPFEVGAQQLQKEVVTAIPATLSIERNQQQIRTFERFEHALGTGVADDGVAQRSAQLREDRRVCEKGDLSRGQVREDLAAQIVRDHPVVSLQPATR